MSHIPPIPEPTTDAEFRRRYNARPQVRQDPLRPDFHNIFSSHLFDQYTILEEQPEMPFHNPHAQDLAREILHDRTTTGLRAKVEGAVEHLTELVAETGCGSTLTFMKEGEDGTHYFYAAVKNGETWYTTARDPRVLHGDDELIAWLVGLEIWEAPQLELTPSRHGKELSNPIEATATDS